ncbi:site-specific recombinase XerD [Pseudomonas nitritireducens]|uniref:Site-specific recombinase XerD n=1 Tax=Pseudomonas nitroreducens TaxID=46680 RepID=A0A7W7NZK4_PSENT|nr:tyrosine-type recombinase/integrase [Pseudomonas nitritireducens]MBB4861307.1 site-specific recombinase XerD [Pseudomonas nitritireducens]
MKIPCPLPIFDDKKYLSELRGAQQEKARPHKGAIPKCDNLDEVLEDYRKALDFLLKYEGSDDTFATYRREIDRFMLWLWYARPDANGKIGKPGLLHELKRADMEAYFDFIKAPPLEWRDIQIRNRFLDVGGERVPNPEWRPFVAKIKKLERKNAIHGTADTAHARENLDEKARPDIEKYKMSDSSYAIAFGTLRSFFTYLLDEEHVGRNPVAQISSKNKKIKKEDDDHVEQSVKRLTIDQTRALFESVESFRETLGEDRYERLRFILSLMMAFYLRISDVAHKDEDKQPVHGNFFTIVDKIEGKQVRSWWFKATGKGNKKRTIPVSEDVLKALRRYRTSQGMSPLPVPKEKTPLFPKARGQGGLTSTRHVRAMLQAVFDEAFKRLRAAGRDDDANMLMQCTVHWLRHTGISEDVTRRPLEHVRDQAGHTNLETTKRYISSSLHEKHESSEHAALLTSIQGD